MKSKLFLIAFALACVIAFFNPSSALLAFVCLGLYSLVTAKPTGICRTTLSVPEILMDVMDAFKTEVPLIGSITTDHSSKTAVKGDQIIAKVSTLPATQNYDPTTGFAGNAANADSLIVDCPVTLSGFKHVPVKINWLTQLASKIPLYKEAIRNHGYVLAKYVFDQVLAQITSANFSNSTSGEPNGVDLEWLESIRATCNLQKMANTGRFGIINSAVATALQNDPRVQSSLYYGQLNGETPYRMFRNICGFEIVMEYPDLPTTGNLTGFFGDKRSLVIATRRIEFSNAAAELGVPEIMQFRPMSDPTGLEMTGVDWQQPGTGDVYVSAAVLFGTAGGAQGGAPGAITDSAGLRVTSF
ncbi:MAG TPA: hypothetical protein VFE51_11630 [Verrucomicrobiae bacterium]|nr:hypothetical protein [Verrucomicrobiae bacterium]